jgi:REP element-mobilizing transposase RayT
MSLPRQVLAGTTYLVTRRCTDRQFLLRPSAELNEIVLYALAQAASVTGVRLHALCVLSNHLHLVVTDPGARLPAFMQYLDSMIARAVNALLGRRGWFWDNARANAVPLAAPGDVLDKAAYALANPVAAGLVPRSRDWPGICSDPAQIGGDPITARRPKTFFRADGYLPTEVTLELDAPPGFASPKAFRDQLAAELARREALHAASGRAFLGAARVRAQRPSGRPTSAEPPRQQRPRIAAADPQLRAEALSRLSCFIRDYRRAWRAWVAGTRDVVFPAGTYSLRVIHGAACCAPG